MRVRGRGMVVRGRDSGRRRKEGGEEEVRTGQG